MQINNEQQLFALKAIFENLEDAVVTHDLNQYILNCNPAAEAMFGVSAGHLFGQSMYLFIPEELHAEQAAIVDRLKSGEKISHLKTIRQTASKKTLPVSITVSAVRNDSGKLIGASHLIRNIEKETEVQEKNNMLGAIIDGSADAIISKTLLGYITSWNKGAEQIFGYKADEIIGKHITMLIPDDRVSEEDVILANIREGKKIEHFETIRKAKSGALIPISLTISPVRNHLGEIVGISKIARNITHKVAAEQRQARLAAIVENSDDAIISKTLEGVITSWNKGAEKIFGYKEEEVTGKHISIIIPEQRMDEEATIIGSIRAGRIIDHFRTVRQKKNGDLVDIALTVSPIKDSKGDIIGASKIARDITAQKQAEQLINELSRKKDEFIAMASHELKTPLTSMKGYLQLLEKKVSDSDRLFVDKIIRQQERLNLLVNDLFDISKIQAGKLDFSFEEFDFSALVKDAIEPIRQASKDYCFECSMPENLIIEADEMRLQQVISNLLNNAVKYSPQGSKIEITVGRFGDQAHFAIRDQGMGIAPENRSHIFSQFFREERQDKKISGLGLGLYISKEIIERHGGSIWVESELGKGSTFCFRIPVKKNKL